MFGTPKGPIFGTPKGPMFGTPKGAMFGTQVVDGPYTLEGGGGRDLKKCMVCTLFKMLIIMDAKISDKLTYIKVNDFIT